MINYRIGAIGITTSYNGLDIGKSEKEIADAIDKANILVAPELTFLQKKGLLSKEEKENLVERLKKVSRGKNTLIVPGTFVWNDSENLYNSCPIITDGKVIDEFYKKSSHLEQSLAEKFNLNYFTDPDYRGTFSWNNLDIALEICRDHGKLKNNSDEEVDLQIVISSNLNGINPDNLITKKNGYTLFCDGNNINNIYVLKIKSKNPFNYDFVREKKEGNMFIFDVLFN